MDEDVTGVVETLIWDVITDNYDDSYVIAEAFVKALARKGYKIVKVDEDQPEAVD